MTHRLLLVTPPFTQLNTPYPATAYIKGFLNTQNIESDQMDLGIETILKLFSGAELCKVLNELELNENEVSENAWRIFGLRQKYINTIDKVIGFLQDRDPTLAHLICNRNFLPEASKFEELEDLEWAFGTMGIRDKARHLATLYLEDIGDFIKEVVDPHFGFSRYAERLGASANSFDDIYAELNEVNSPVISLALSLLEKKVELYNPTLVCFSVPFPGNLFAALKCGQWLKENHPEIKVAMGGGYPNTELRSLTEPRVFEFVDFISLDDGETPLITLLSYLDGTLEAQMMKRTFMLHDGVVVYCNGSLFPDVAQEKVGTPDYEGLSLKNYLSVIQLPNSMHRLWSDGRWNKLTMAHGCYWGKCTFCDLSLDYIKNYEASSAATIVDRMETLISQTGESGFHFVDEAAPPSLMKSVALEILKRKLVVSWWTNIRFEKSFHKDLCRLLAASGCIAVSGGLEVASDRLLKLIDKGVTVKQVAQVNRNFIESGIMVHAYLMYGFPTQTDQETIDSLEVVRQMFKNGVMDSAFWHRFAMTAHSPVGISPHVFNVSTVSEKHGAFANNDLQHNDPTGADHSKYADGLKKSLYNYMHGVCIDYPLDDWFELDVPATSLSPDLVENYLDEKNARSIHKAQQLIWIGGSISYELQEEALVIQTLQDSLEIKCDSVLGIWIAETLQGMFTNKEPMSVSDFQDGYLSGVASPSETVVDDPIIDGLRQIGLLFL